MNEALLQTAVIAEENGRKTMEMKSLLF